MTRATGAEVDIVAAGGADGELREENERLRLRVAELERMLARREPAPEAVDAGEHRISYRSLFEHVPAPAAVYRRDGLAITATSDYMNFLRTLCETIVWPRNILQEPKARETGASLAFERALRGETVRMPPIRHDGADGGREGGDDRQLWIETTYVPVRDEAGVCGVVEYHLDVSEQKQAQEASRASSTLLREIIDKSPLLIYAKDMEGRYILVSRRYEEFMDVTWDRLRGKTDYDLYPHEMADSYAMHDRQVITTGQSIEREDTVPWRDGVYHFITVKFPLRDSKGRTIAACSVSTDITSIKSAEAENRRLQEEIIRVQRETLKAISTPLLPIAEGVVVMPLIGNVDRNRVEQVLDTLLNGIVAYRARIVILDITGVPAVDTAVANALIQAAQAVKLLGAEAVLTGIQPGIAQTLVQLGTDLPGVVTLGTLQSGISYALRK